MKRLLLLLSMVFYSILAEERVIVGNLEYNPQVLKGILLYQKTINQTNFVPIFYPMKDSDVNIAGRVFKLNTPNLLQGETYNWYVTSVHGMWQESNGTTKYFESGPSTVITSTIPSHISYIVN